MISPRIFILLVVIGIIVSAILYLQNLKPILKGQNSLVQSITQGLQQNSFAKYVEISQPTGFINTGPITIAELIGKKVILVDFWTYSCINCQRTTPYLNAWYQKYQDKGLVILGVHTPEFEFEKKYDNVLQATKKANILYPVILDNNYGTWSAYNNRYWPAKYLIDLKGNIVYYHFGEGKYEETEKKIQELLNLSADMAKPENVLQVDYAKLQSPETYFGAFRNNNLGNGIFSVVGRQNLKDLQKIDLNLLYLVGEWDIQNQYAQNVSKPARIKFRFNAKSVYMVASSEQTVRVKVFQDGRLLESGGEDVIMGEVNIQEERLYKIIENPDYGEHLLELEIMDEGLKAFSFTFG